MKKFFITALVLFLGLVTDAQGIWRTGLNEPNKEESLDGNRYYTYDAEGMGTLTLWDWDSWEFKIVTEKGKFYIDGLGAGGGHVTFYLRLYHPNGQLEEEVQSILDYNYDRNMAFINKDWWYSPGKKKKIKKIINSLKSGYGYVRIICKRQDLADFDLTIRQYNISDKDKDAYIEFTQVTNQSTYFYDSKNYGSLDEVVKAANEKKLKGETLKRGVRFKVLSMDWQTMCAKIQLVDRRTGWVHASMVPNKRDFLPYLQFRNEFMPYIDKKAVAPGMSRQEVFISTGFFYGPANKDSYRASGDYVWYVNSRGNYLFYKNSLYFASSCNGAFYYQCHVHYSLKNVSRNESVMDNNISSATSYSDDILSIVWMIDRNRADFNLKNKASGSIKILWDEMAFVGFNKESQRVIHKGIKYSEKEKEQTPSIVARNAEINDLIIPANKIYYKKSWMKWCAYPFVDDFMFSPNDKNIQSHSGKIIQFLLPIVINEKRYEYLFSFEISNINFRLFNQDYYKDTRVADELN